MYKKVFICMITLVLIFISLSPRLVKANENVLELLENFDATEASFCYQFSLSYDENSEIDDINVELSLIIYEGKIGDNNAYVLYNRYTREIIEFNLNSYSPWEISSRPVSDAAPVYVSSNIHLFVRGTQVLVLETVTENPQWLEYPEFAALFNPVKKIDLHSEPFDANQIIYSENSINNAFYFENLSNNFGDNINGSCGYIAISMLLSYYNEFYDQSIIPETITYNNNEQDVSIFKSDFYNKSYDREYDISKMESPGANDNFHNFLIEYGSKCVLGENELVYGMYKSQVKEILASYLNDFYGNSNLQTRYVVDERVSEGDYSNSVYFEEDYEFYESQQNEDLLWDVNNEFIYELDICNEIDNGNPVILFLNNFNAPYDYYTYLENYNGELDNVKYTSYEGHAVVAYGYVVTNGGIYYKCHMGWKNEDGRYNYNSVYVFAGTVCEGIILKDFSEQLEVVEDSNYIYENDGCILYMPTNHIFQSYNELVLACNNIDFNDAFEYYYCDCNNEHILYQKGHEFLYHEYTIENHVKYCKCGFSLIESHSLYHDTYYDGHYELCSECSYQNVHSSSVTYMCLEETKHIWICSECNLNGVAYHTYVFESIDNQFHKTNCLICDYENYVPHGVEFDMWYYRIDNQYHTAYCSCCGENWIEAHNSNCLC